MFYFFLSCSCYWWLIKSVVDSYWPKVAPVDWNHDAGPLIIDFPFPNIVSNSLFPGFFVTDSQPGKSDGEAPGPEPIRAAGAPGQPREGGVYGSGVWRGKKEASLSTWLPFSTGSLLWLSSLDDVGFVWDVRKRIDSFRVEPSSNRLEFKASQWLNGFIVVPKSSN